MCAPAHRAGPGPSVEPGPPLGSEAAGPASPRLAIEEVGFRIGADGVEAHARLACGPHCFTGTATGAIGAGQTWKLAAAASVAALQQCLQQCGADPPTPQITLLYVTASTTGLGQEAIHSTVRLRHGSNETDLLGSALVRNDRCSTAVAAALDAASRPLGPFLLLASAGNIDRACTPEPMLATAPTAPTSLPDPPQPIEAEIDVAMSADLVAADAEPAEALPSRSAEPAARPAPAQTNGTALGVTISPTSIRAAAVTHSGEVLAEARLPSPGGTEPGATLTRACETARDAIAGLNSSGNTVTAIGVALPGRLSAQEGMCISCGDFPSWRSVDVAAPFAGEFDLPVTLISPTEAAAFAELQFGAAEGLSNLIYARIGIDIDVAVILDGKPLSTAQSGPRQAGHVVIETDGPRCACGQNGCWQVLANRESLVARAMRALRSGTPSALGAAVDNRLGAITPALVVRMAAGGDAVARRAVDETGRYLAVGLANLIALFDPEAVIVDCSPAQLGAALLQAAQTALKLSPRAQALARCALLSPQLGDAAPVLGAAAWASSNASSHHAFGEKQEARASRP